MKKKIFILCVSIVCMLSLAFSAQAIQGVQTYHLQNGLTVLIKEDKRFPLVSVRLLVKAGSAWERPEEAGLSHFLEHMVFKGSKTSQAGVEKLVEEAGGYLNASTSFDVTTYLTDLPSAQWEKAMTAVRDLAFDPLLKQSDLDAELEVVLAEKKQREDSPMTKLFQAAMAQTLKGTPYEFPIIGNEKALRAMTPQMLRDYIQRRYDPRDMVLAVAGNVEKNTVLKKANELFGVYQNHNILEEISSFKAKEQQKGFSVKVEKGAWKKAFVSLSFPIPQQNDVTAPAADILAHMLAGDDTGLLTRKLHIENHIADSINATSMGLERAGIFMILAQMDADKVERYLQEASALLSSLKSSDFTKQEIERARLNLEDSYYRSLETISGIAGIMGSSYFYDRSGMSEERYLSILNKTNAADIDYIISNYIQPNALNVTSLVPKESAVTEESLKSSINKTWSLSTKAEKAKEGQNDTNNSAEKISLKNGGTLILQRDTSLPYISAALIFNGGELLSADSQEGLADLTASVLSTGTEKRTYREITEFLSDRASTLRAVSGIRHFNISLDTPKKFSADTFALLKEIFQQPAFRAEDIERCIKEQKSAITNTEDSVVGLLIRNMRHSLFAGGAYAHRDHGTVEFLDKVKRDDIAAYWEKQRKQPWILSIAGDFDREKMVAFAESLPRAENPAVKSSAPKWSDKKELVISLKGRNQAAYMMIFPTADTRSEDRAALRLLEESIGGFTGKLYQEVREKQSLGYSVFPIDWAKEDVGFLGFCVIASPENLAKARKSFEQIAKELKTELLSRSILDSANARAIAQYNRGKQSRFSRAIEAGEHTFNNRPLDYTEKLLEKMKGVSSEQIRQISNKYLDVTKSYNITVTP